MCGGDRGLPCHTHFPPWADAKRVERIASLAFRLVEEAHAARTEGRPFITAYGHDLAPLADAVDRWATEAAGGPLGRVNAVYRLFATLTMPVGAGAAGLLAAWAGAACVYATGGLLVVATAVLLLPGMWRPLRRMWPAGSEHPATAEPA
ncbi:hypothetical protein [Catenuloplanes japonicus]|uniref:hypothetical protein n=1 Tax=Catenuloplanes japonicus TaxID=33876 RepID=UPI0005243769|nr:hypothetical protein [Catenuloplanes japonicus]